MNLYTICVLPFETAFRHLYALLYAISGSYGFSLVLMSLVSTAIISPFLRYTNRAQLRERHIQDILNPQIDRIKSESTGLERHNRISELYRRYAYHPIYSIRSAFGVLIQVPLLLGAYYMLRGNEDIVSRTFGIISDLSEPDALLWGLNLLPVLMTVINISSACVTPGFGGREILQAWIIALLFLVLLYGAPSALLIFWTCNNLWGLLLNLRIYRKEEKSRPAFSRVAEVFSAFPRLKWNSRFVNMLHLTLFLLTLQSVISILGFKAFDIMAAPKIQTLLSLVLGLLLLIVSIVVFMRSQKLSLYLRAAACATLLCPVLYLWGRWFVENFALIVNVFGIDFWSSSIEIGYSLTQRNIYLAQFLTSVALKFFSCEKNPKRKEARNYKQDMINWLFILCAILIPVSCQASSNTDYLTIRTAGFYFGFFLFMGIFLCAATAFLWRDTLAGNNNDVSMMLALFMFVFIMNPSICKYFARHLLLRVPTIVFLAFFIPLGTLFSVVSVSSRRAMMTFMLAAIMLSVSVDWIGAYWKDGGQTAFTDSGKEQTDLSAIEEVAGIKEDERVSVYSLVYDGIGDLQALESAGVNTEPLVNLLWENDFKIYDGTYTLYPDSLRSMSRTYDISDALSSLNEHGQNATGSQLSLLNTSMERDLLSGSAKVFQIFSHNGYGTASIQSHFMTGGKMLVDEYWPPVDKISHENELIAVLIKSILSGAFSWDMEFINIYSKNTYHEFLREKMAVKKSPWFTIMHAGFPGHGQLSGKLRPYETELYIDRLTEALAYMKDDIKAIRENNPDAIIIIFGDHGPYLTGDGTSALETYDGPEGISELMIRDRYGTLVAIRWPDRTRAEKYDKDLIVNQDIFPVVFSYLTDSPEPLKLMIKNKKAVLKNHVFIDNGVFIPFPRP